MRWPSFRAFALMALAPSFAQAALVVKPEGVSNPVLEGQRIYYAVQKYVSGSLTSPEDATWGCPTAIDTGFKILDVSRNRYVETTAGVSTNHLQLRVASTTALTATTGRTLVAMVRVSNGSVSKYVPIAGVNDLVCGVGVICYKAGQTDIASTSSYSHYYAVPFSSGGTVLDLYLADICSDAYNQLSSTQIAGCELNTDPAAGPALSRPESVPAANGSPIALEIVITEIDPAVSVAPTAAAKASLTTQIYTQVAPPTMAACNVYQNSALYYPGDGSIYIDSNAFTLSACSTAPSGSGAAPAVSLIGVGGDAALNPDVSEAFRTNNTLVTEGGYGSFVQLGGFTNATTLTNNQYNLSFMLRNAAGLLAPPPGVTSIHTNIAAWGYNAVDTPNNCKIPDVQTSAINGLIAQNRCFIATSAFRHDSQSAPVAVLRAFRDQWLESNTLGRRLVRLYYSVSPQIAEQMDDAPVLRLVALKFLAPAEAIAWIWVQIPWLGGALLGLGLLLIFWTAIWRRAFLGLGILLFGSLTLQIDQAAHAESYSETMRSILEPREESAGYSERERSKLGAADSSSLIEQVRPHLEEKKSSEGYTEQVREALPPEGGIANRPSVTERSTTEEKSLEPRYEGDIHFAGGLRYGVMATRGISGGNNNFQTLYGAAYVPEASIFGEWQPFHSEWFGNIGLIGSVGIAVFRGNGLFDVSGLVNPLSGSAFSDASRTQMILNLVPVTLGAIYRFNLLRILRPFVAASGVAYGMIEVRSDGGSAKRTFGAGTLLEGGVSLLMDWFEPGKAWDAYASAGIRHTYLTVEYAMLMPLYGDLLYSNSGFHAGLTFEF